MVATTLLKGAEAAPDASEHPGHEEGVKDEEGLDTGLHPWARAMSERGFNFNGGERTKLFLSRKGGGFADISDVTGADSPLDGRSLVAADLDDDGDVDLFVHNIQRERHHLFRNELDPSTGFIEMRLERSPLDGLPREAIGAIVRVDVAGSLAAQVLSRGAGYASCQPPSLHFGTGTAKSATVQVRWPGGAVEEFGAIPSGSRVVLVEGTGTFRVRERTGRSLSDPLAPGLKVPLGRVLPPIDVVDSEGRPIRLDPSKAGGGESFELLFWASYCRPCVQELPMDSEQHRSGERRIVALSVDVPRDHDRARELIKNAGGLPLCFLSMEDEANEQGLDLLVDLMRLPIPTVLHVGPDGRLLGVRTGAVE